MHLMSRVMRYLATRILAEHSRPSQDTARENAAQATATMQERRRDREGVEAYLEELRRGNASSNAERTGDHVG